MEINRISLNPVKIIRLLSFVALLLVLASIGGQLIKYLLGHPTGMGFIRLFNLNEELSVPTFYSALLLFINSLLFAVIYLLTRKESKQHKMKWLVLSFGFLYMAFDEASQIHEMLGTPIRSLMGNANLGILYYAWFIPFLIIIPALGIYFTRFLLYLPVKTRTGFLISAFLYLSGAVGMEMLGGRYAELHSTENLVWNLLGSLEESLEIAGTIVLTWTLLSYISNYYKDLTFNLEF